MRLGDLVASFPKLIFETASFTIISLRLIHVLSCLQLVDHAVLDRVHTRVGPDVQVVAAFDDPVIAVAPNNELLEKLKSNLEEVRARGGRLYVFADLTSGMQGSAGTEVLNIAAVDDLIAPIIYTVPLQLLAYHVAVLKGADVDQPRNLAKSVTVE